MKCLAAYQNPMTPRYRGSKWALKSCCIRQPGDPKGDWIGISGVCNAVKVGYRWISRKKRQNSAHNTESVGAPSVSLATSPTTRCHQVSPAVHPYMQPLQSPAVSSSSHWQQHVLFQFPRRGYGSSVHRNIEIERAHARGC